MAGSALALPRDIPWKVLAVTSGHDGHGFLRSHISLSMAQLVGDFRFQPALENLPEGNSRDDRLTYLRVTSTITGYRQSSEADTQEV